MIHFAKIVVSFEVPSLKATGEMIDQIQMEDGSVFRVNASNPNINNHYAGNAVAGSCGK